MDRSQVVALIREELQRSDIANFVRQLRGTQQSGTIVSRASANQPIAAGANVAISFDTLDQASDDTAWDGATKLICLKPGWHFFFGNICWVAGAAGVVYAGVRWTNSTGSPGWFTGHTPCVAGNQPRTAAGAVLFMEKGDAVELLAFNNTATNPLNAVAAGRETSAGLLRV